MPEFDKFNRFFFPFVRKLCQTVCILSSACLEPPFHTVDVIKFLIKTSQKWICIIKIVEYIIIDNISKAMANAIFFCLFVSSFLMHSELLIFPASEDKFGVILYFVPWYLIDCSTLWILLGSTVWRPTKNKLFPIPVHCSVCLGMEQKSLDRCPDKAIMKRSCYISCSIYLVFLVAVYWKLEQITAN